MATISYRDQVKIASYLVSRLEDTLSGRVEDECYDLFPHDKYHLGVLAPTQNTDMDSLQPDTDVETTSLPEADEVYSSAKREQRNTSQDEGGDEETLSSVEKEDSDRFEREDVISQRGPSSALGIEFLVQPLGDAIELEFEISFAVYFRRFPTWEQQLRRIRSEQNNTPDDDHTIHSNTVQLSDRHVRYDLRTEVFRVTIVPGNRITVKDPFTQQLVQAFEEERSRTGKKLHDVWRQIPRMSAPASAFQNEQAYQEYLANRQEPISLPDISVSLDIRSMRMPDGLVRIGAYVVNRTRADDNSSLSSAANTQRHLYDVRMHCSIKTGLLEPIEYISSPENYQFDPRVFAVGQNCSAVVDTAQEKATIWTESLARYAQHRLASKNLPAAPFEALSTDPIPVLQTIHESMLQYADEWLTNLESGAIVLRTQEEHHACANDLEIFKNEAQRFMEGMQALQADDRLLEAFKAMHRVFIRVGASRNITQWRLFQIGYIVTQLPALAVREGKVQSDILNYADVLWFPTGGGKTEAYLGLISCALLYDRMRGKDVGITAWLRFPLRMLSVQQLQRAVKVVYETEQERLKLWGEQSKNQAPFGLGYFVGKSSTPNQLSNAPWAGKWKMSQLAEQADLRNQLRLVRTCPKCNQNAVEIEVNQDEFRIHHICQNCKTNLHIYVSDDEIYRYLPSVLIGTVDKLPSVAWRKHFTHIWGGVDAKCPKHGYRSGKYCTVFGCKETEIPVQLYDPVPSLQIQDELHLLKEELGTFAGHYETLAEVCESRVSLPPKMIAATATVEGLDRQSRHLYSRPARRFPSRGYELGQSFYTTFRVDEEEQLEIARVYLAFKPPYLRPPEASKQVLQIHHQTIRDLYDLLRTDGPTVVRDELNLTDAQSEQDILALLDKYDATLTYVGSKAHGSRIERALSDDVSKLLRPAGDRQLEVAYLNGESTLDDIAETIDNLEGESEWNEDTRLDAVIGTSLVSHGVDVSRFNFMVMSGMPGRTAEYIQASSRSGRSFVGLITVALSPWLLREQSFYHRFTSFHYHMEHLVEPVPINRFSRFAVDKTMPGIIAGLLNAYLSPAHQGVALDKVREVDKAINEDNRFTQDELLELILDALDVHSDIHSQSLQSALDEKARERFRAEIRRLLAPGAAERVTDALSRKPMTSLRDIDEPVPFEPKEYAYSVTRWTRR